MKYFGKEIRKHPLKISGSLLEVDMGASSGSTAIKTNNVTIGYPTANRWKDNLVGSYLNFYDHDTNVSEMLRFMAGVLSHSLDTAAPTPNTKYWNSVSTNYSGQSTTSKSSLFHGVLGHSSYRLSQHWTSSAYIQMNETQSFIEAEDYFISKGFMNASERGTFGNHTGVNPFNDSYCANIPGTILQSGQFGSLTFTNTSVSAGSSIVSSSVDSQLFGLGELTNGGATSYTVRVIASQSFSDTQTDTTPDASSTYHTKSFVDYTLSAFDDNGDSNGLYLTRIETAQPAVIPAAYQEGRFQSVDAPQTGRKRHGGSTNNTSISSSGYYLMHDVRVGLKSGSMADFQYKNGSNSNTVFFMPSPYQASYTSQGAMSSNILSGSPTATISNATIRETSFSATSRSLSGAPYLLTTTYAFAYSAESTNHFNPVYGRYTTPLQNSISTNGWNSIGSSNLSNTSVTVSTSGVQTNSGTAGVRSSDKATQRTNGTIPHITDGTFLSSSYSFSLSSNYENVGQNRTSNNSLNYSLALRTTSRNYAGSSQTSTSATQTFYNATKFGQPSSSGSMAIYSRAQGYDNGSLTGTSETFLGEDHRIKINNNVTAFNGDAFTTDTFQTNDEGDAVLGNYDLQVKPGYLVDPGGSYGYWFASNFGSGTYKYYIRRFQTSGVKGSLTVGCGKSLEAWTSTGDGVSMVVIFKSGTSAGVNTSITNCRLYDPTQTVSNLIESGISQDNHKNPFSSAVDLYGNTGGSTSGTNFVMPLRNADGMFLDGSDNGFYVVIRYKGDPSPVTSITTSTS